MSVAATRTPGHCPPDLLPLVQQIAREVKTNNVSGLWTCHREVTKKFQGRNVGALQFLAFFVNDPDAKNDLVTAEGVLFQAIWAVFERSLSGKLAEEKKSKGDAYPVLVVEFTQWIKLTDSERFSQAIDLINKDRWNELINFALGRK